MKKPLIYIILILIAGSTLFYFYYFEQPLEKAVVPINNSSDADNREKKVVNKEDIESGKIENYSLAEPEELTDYALEYRKTYRNPFEDYNNKAQQIQEVIKSINTVEVNQKNVLKEEIEMQVKSKPKPTKEMIRELIPFQLTGIIGTNETRLAIIKNQQGSKVISKGDEINDFFISEILTDGILVGYEGIKLRLEIGSDDR